MHERPVHHPPEIGARRGRWTSPGRVDAGLPRNRCGNGLHDLLHADAALAVHPATARGTFAPRAVVATAGSASEGSASRVALWWRDRDIDRLNVAHDLADAPHRRSVRNQRL